MLNAPRHNPDARILHGFCIHQDTLDNLDPLEQVWARKLIAEGVWRLIPNDEATP